MQQVPHTCRAGQASTTQLRPVRAHCSLQGASSGAMQLALLALRALPTQQTFSLQASHSSFGLAIDSSSSVGNSAAGSRGHKDDACA